MTRIYSLLTTLATILALSLPAAAQITSLQDPLSPQAQTALDRARGVAEDALGAYSSYHPDQPLFREAIRLGRSAVRLAPDNPETLRFLAELYGVTGFYGPAFGTWQQFLEAGGTLDAQARPQVAKSGAQVGFARYSQGDLAGALTAYRRVAELEPGSALAQRWSGRILLEQNRPRAALPYWQRLQNLRPGDAGAAYFLELAQAGVAHGLGAARAFYGGVSAFEAGNLEAARTRFVRATTLSPDYAAAWGYLGRVAFGRGEFAAAETAYTRAHELEPQNQTYGYFVQQAQSRQGE